MPTTITKSLLEWQSAARPFKKREREVFLTAGAIITLISVILLFVREFLLIAVLLSLYFVFWVLNTVAPEKVNHKITVKGIETSGKTYRWEELGRFWFTEKWGNRILNIETKKRFPRQIMVLLPEAKTNKEIKDVLSKYLEFEKPGPNWLNGASEWLQKKVPLEKEERP